MKLDVKRLLISIVGIIIFCSLCIFAINMSSLNPALKNSLSLEFIGSGILGAIITAVFFNLQRSDEFDASKIKAETFFKNKLLVDLHDVIDRNPSLWNLDGGKKFYLDASRINSFFDVYQDNFNLANDYSAYFPNQKIINNLNKLYLKVRHCYVLGEKLDDLFRAIIRQIHHSKSIHPANDYDRVKYIKGKLFADIDDEGLKTWLNWTDIPPEAQEALTYSRTQKTITDLISELKQCREELQIIEKDIFEETTKLLGQ